MSHPFASLTPKWSKYIPEIEPDTGLPFKLEPKQLAFLMLPHREALFGGMAGVGKTYALLTGALQYADVPGYHAIIFRKSLTDAALGGAVLDLAMKWLDRPDVRFDRTYSTFTFPEGSSLVFGYLKNEGDHERYKSAQFMYAGFDELTDFPENVYKFLISRVRRPIGMQAPLRIRSATNPGGLGHQWVKTHFAITPDGQLPNGNTRWVGKNPHRPFIPAYRKDNPHLDVIDYEYGLSQLGLIDRLRMKEGDWAASEASRFQEHWFSNRWEVRGAYFHCRGLQKSWMRNAVEIFVTTDPAATVGSGVYQSMFKANKDPSYTVISVWGRTWDNYLLWLDQIRVQAEIPDILKIMLSVSKTYRPGKVIVEANGVGKGVYQVAEMLGLPIHPIITSTDKLVNSTAAQTRSENGRIVLPVSAPWIPVLFGELLVWTGHPNETADQVDALSNAALYVQDQAGFSEREYHTDPASIPELVGESWANGLSIPTSAWTQAFQG